MTAQRLVVSSREHLLTDLNPIFAIIKPRERGKSGFGIITIKK